MHLRTLSRVNAVSPRPADGLLVKQAQIEVAAGVLDLIEQTLGIVKSVTEAR